jgi:hypothetical protein
MRKLEEKDYIRLAICSPSSIDSLRLLLNNAIVPSFLERALYLGTLCLMFIGPSRYQGHTSSDDLSHLPGIKQLLLSVSIVQLRAATYCTKSAAQSQNALGPTLAPTLETGEVGASHSWFEVVQGDSEIRASNRTATGMVD